jgi:hypothetical protein
MPGTTAGVEDHSDKFITLRAAFTSFAIAQETGAIRAYQGHFVSLE